MNDETQIASTQDDRNVRITHKYQFDSDWFYLYGCTIGALIAYSHGDPMWMVTLKGLLSWIYVVLSIIF